MHAVLMKLHVPFTEIGFAHFLKSIALKKKSNTLHPVLYR